MTLFSEKQIDGTPLDRQNVRDVSGAEHDHQQPTQQTEDQDQDKEWRGQSTAQLAHHVDSCGADGSDATDADEKNAHAAELKPINTPSHQHDRPDLTRQATGASASFAAAPFTGPYVPDASVSRDQSQHRSHHTKHEGVGVGGARPRSSSDSSSTASTLREVPSSLQTASRVSTDAYGNTVSTHSPPRSSQHEKQH